MSFSFRGEISGSKSIFNRALIAQSFSEHVEIHGLSQSDDVLYLQKALQQFKAGETDFFCGDGGTTFRFLALRVSRKPGTYKLSGSPQLFSRPMKELLHFFKQVGVEHKVEQTSLTITTSGWKIPPMIVSSSTESSQFLSAIALSSWDLPSDLNVQMPRQIPSRGYLQMTFDILAMCGCKLKIQEATASTDPVIMIKAHQKPTATVIHVEQDMSSLFALAGCALMDGEIEIHGVPQKSLQPDVLFTEFFRRMDVDFKWDRDFYIRRQKKFKSIDADLTHVPDLFPVLAVLCARAEGISTLTGLENLQFKESNRLTNTMNLLKLLGRRVDIIDSGVMIHGKEVLFSASGEFDPHGDHRMAMAAQVAKLGGANLKIVDKSVIHKSFPEFWAILGEDDV